MPRYEVTSASTNDLTETVCTSGSDVTSDGAGSDGFLPTSGGSTHLGLFNMVRNDERRHAQSLREQRALAATESRVSYGHRCVSATPGEDLRSHHPNLDAIGRAKR